MKFLRNKLAVTITVLSVTFIVLIGVSVKRQSDSVVESGVGGVIASVQGVVYRASTNVSNWFGFVTHFSEIKTENEQLKTENTNMKNKVAEYDTLKSKYDQLSKIKDYQDQNSAYNYKNCNVIGKSSGEAGDIIYIDAGKNSGVKVGYAVITTDGLVGKVLSVSATYSTVGTLNNTNVRVGAVDTRTQNNSGLVTGYEDDSNSKLAMISGLAQDADIKVNDAISTYGTVYPPNISIGKVISVGKDASTISTNAVIQPSVDFSKLSIVSVVIPKNSDTSEIKY